MARAHASGIELRDGPVPEPITDQPRVVLAVETDLRRVPTHPRLPEARAGLPPSGATTSVPSGGRAGAEADPAPGAAPAPASPASLALPSWVRLVFALVMLVVLVVLVQKLRAPVAEDGAGPERAVAFERAPAAPRVPPARPSLEPLAPAPPPAVRDPMVEPPPPRPPPPSASVEPARRPAKPPAPPAPKAAFTPPFQLPGETN